MKTEKMIDHNVLAPKIVQFPRAIKNCNEIIKYADTHGEWVKDYFQDSIDKVYIRESASIFHYMPGFEEVFSNHLQSLVDAKQTYNRLYTDVSYLASIESQINMSRYLNGGYIRIHSDRGGREGSVSVACYYNDDYQGGELYFYDLDLKIKPNAGDIFIFPSETIHSALPAFSENFYTKYLSLHIMHNLT